MSKDQRDAWLQDWMDREAIAESMIPLIGTLYRQKSIVSSIYGRPVINRSVIELLKAHRFVRPMENEELSVQDTYPLLQALTEMDVAQAHIDLGKLAVKYRTEGNGKDVKEFLAEELASLNGEAGDSENRDVVLYGFGRIGRLLARILIEKEGGGNGPRLFQ